MPHAAHQPAAANGGDQRVEPRRILQHLARDRALARDHVHIVERGDECQAELSDKISGVRGGIVEGVTDQHHGRAVLFGLAHLHRWREARHDDGRRDAEAARVIGNALRVIARARGDNAARALVRG